MPHFVFVLLFLILNYISLQFSSTFALLTDGGNVLRLGRHWRSRKQNSYIEEFLFCICICICISFNPTGERWRRSGVESLVDQSQFPPVSPSVRPQVTTWAVFWPWNTTNTDGQSKNAALLIARTYALRDCGDSQVIVCVLTLKNERISQKKENTKHMLQSCLYWLVRRQDLKFLEVSSKSDIRELIVSSGDWWYQHCSVASYVKTTILVNIYMF